MSLSPQSGFRSLNLTPIWSLIETVGQLREDQKRKFKSSRLWRGEESTHIIALAGEIVAALAMNQPMDASLKIKGDDGYDFPDGTDVKTVSYWPPILKHPKDSKKWPKKFALVYFDKKIKKGYFIGSVTADQLKNSGKTKQFRSDAPVNCIMEIKDIVSKKDGAGN